MTRLRLGIFLSLFATSLLSAQWHSIGNVDSSKIESSTLILYSGDRALAVQALTDDLIHIRMFPVGTNPQPASPAVVRFQWPSLNTRIAEGPSSFDLKTRVGSVRISKTPIRLSFLDENGKTINADDERGMAWDGDEVRVWKKMPGEENYFGFGEKSGRLNKREEHVTMWNSDIPAYKADTDPLYESIPFFYGIKNGRAYGVFFDNPYRTSFDMGKESGKRYSFGASGGELNYYFFFGPEPKRILERFTDLVGRMPLPPLWSLGYQQCRWSYAPEERVREIARNFRKRRIPADVIYLDIDYMEGYRIFTWNQDRFPDPAKMISDLAKDGFRIAVIVDPGIKSDSSYHAFRSGLSGDHFLKYPDGNLFIGKVWPGQCAFPDFSRAASREWWGDQFKVLTEAGVRGWWNDMNEPSVFDVPTKTIDYSVLHYDDGRFTTHEKNHNTYGMLMTQATYEGVRRLVPNERPFVLTRASYAGGHRFSAAWTGDNIASWEHLQMAVPMCLNLSISGQPFVGTDIGGFIGYPSGELFARWLQLGVLTPLMRAHSVINERNKEPWEYGAAFESINRKTIELRYRLLPYIYATMMKASQTGIPAMRPLIFEYPLDGNFTGNDTEFMFGDHLLVAPVLWEAATTRSLRLPEGTWFDYWTDEKLEGGKHITVDAPIERIPFFVKAGSIIPSQSVVQYTGQKPDGPLMMNAYPGQSLQSVYYTDDGVSFDYERGKFFSRTMWQELANGKREIYLGKAEGSFKPAHTMILLRCIGELERPTTVTKGARVLPPVSRDVLLKQEGWFYDSKTREVLLSVYESSDEIQLSLRVK